MNVEVGTFWVNKRNGHIAKVVGIYPDNQGLHLVAHILYRKGTGDFDYSAPRSEWAVRHWDELFDPAPPKETE